MSEEPRGAAPEEELWEEDSPQELPGAVWFCATCGTENDTPVDPALGFPQKFTEDCRTCCHPNLLRITQDAERDLIVEVTFDE